MTDNPKHGTLPEGWKWRELGEVAEFINGKAFKPSDWGTEGLPIVRIQNLTNINKPFNYYGGDYENRYFIRNNDILISWSASLGVFKWNRGDALLNQHIFKAEPNNEFVDRDFFFYVVQTKVDEMKQRVHGSTMKHITKRPFLSLKIPLPPPPTQRKIVEILERADAVRRKRQEVDEKTARILQAVFYKKFIESPKEEYEIRTLSQVCNKITDGAHKTPRYIEEGIPFLRVTDIKNDNIDWENTKYLSEEEHQGLIKRCKPEKGDILYSKNGTIGVAKTIDWNREFSIFVSLALLKPKRELIHPKFLESFLNSDYALRQATERSKTGTVTNLHLIEIKQMKIPLPPIDIQQKFVNPP